jgi:branched-chain amino acid transport system permease protein
VNRFLPTNPRARSAVLSIGAVVLTLVFTQLVLPGGNNGGRGAPAAIIFQGLINGVLVGLSAVGIVLLYRTQRIINFSQGAVGTVGYVTMLLFLQFTHLPFLLSFAIALVISTLLGTAIGVVMLRFFNGSRLFLTVVTIVGVPTVLGLLAFINRMPFFPPFSERPASGALNPESLKLLLPFPAWKFRVGSFPVDFGFTHVFALDVAAIALIGIGIFFRYTRTGTAVRAMAENPERASLLGIGVGKLSVIIWTIAGLLAGITVCLTGLVSSQVSQGGGGSGLEILLPILVAAIVARMRSFPTAVFAGIIVSVLQSAWVFRVRTDVSLFDGFMLLAVAGILLFQRKQMGRSETGAAISWSATDEPRPIPKELRDVPSLKWSRRGIIVLTFFVFALFPFVASTSKVFLASTVFLNAIVVLSLVVLTGWTGQVSLGQYGFVAVGAVVGGSLIQRASFPFWVAVPIAAVVAGAVAVLVGIPALRIKGLFLLVVTFGFGVAIRSLLFTPRYFGWLLPKVSEQIPRPTLFFLDFSDNKSMYFLCLVAMALAIVVVMNMRRSRIGRVLIALRENEANVQSFGVSALRMKLTAFAISGVIAGFAGAIYAVLSRAVSPDSYAVIASVNTFVSAVVGGVSSPAGALLGSAYFTLSAQFLGGNPILASLVQAGGPAVILFLAPGGLISVVNAMRDSVLRIVAQRRRIVVPSLFADYDPDLLARQLIPLGEPDPLSGLAALPHERRFTMASELYQGRGERIIDKLAPPRQAEEAAAIGAAARRAEELEDEMPKSSELEAVGAAPEAQA